MAPADAEVVVNAFHALLEIRFVVQAGAGDGAAGNQIASQDLNGFDCRVLLEALRQARTVQRLLGSRFQIET